MCLQTQKNIHVLEYQIFNLNILYTTLYYCTPITYTYSKIIYLHKCVEISCFRILKNL